MFLQGAGLRFVIQNHNLTHDIWKVPRENNLVFYLFINKVELIPSYIIHSQKGIFIKIDELLFFFNAFILILLLIFLVKT